MDYEVILRELAPCGLDCSRCAAYGEGEIKKLSTMLNGSLENFEKIAEKMAGHVPALAGFRQFKEVLEFFAGAVCPGCRSGGAQNPFCSAKSCYKEKGVDFCFQCEEFPCSKSGYHSQLRDKWIANNSRMREVGVDQYYREQKSRPRY